MRQLTLFDAGYPDVPVARQECRTAYKNYTCVVCGKSIDKGMPYRYTFTVQNGMPMIWREHI